MTVQEAINELEKMLKDLPLKVFDWRKNLGDDIGDGSSEGVYDFEITHETYTQDELDFKEDRDGKPYQSWVGLAFDNDDYDAIGGNIYDRD